MPEAGRVNHVRLLRYAKGLSQLEVAAASGVSRQTLVAVEGGSEPSAPTAKALADFYDVPVERILGLPVSAIAPDIEPDAPTEKRAA